MTRIIKPGAIFGRLTVFVKSNEAVAMWICYCECGNQKLARPSDLRAGKLKSCGCLRIENTAKMRTTHGATRGGVKHPPEYNAWQNIKARCHNASNRDFLKYYGSRGIKVCDRWRESFEAFLADMGPRPSSRHSIDRIDNNGDYEPGNCRWATHTEQNNNTRPRRTYPPRGSDGRFSAEGQP